MFEMKYCLKFLPQLWTLLHQQLWTIDGLVFNCGLPMFEILTLKHGLLGQSWINTKLICCRQDTHYFRLVIFLV